MLTGLPERHRLLCLTLATIRELGRHGSRQQAHILLNKIAKEAEFALERDNQFQKEFLESGR